MAKVEVGKTRSQIENTNDGLRISIPVKKNYFLLLFLSFWLFGWVFGEGMSLTELTSGKSSADGFLFFWLCAWTVGGVFAIGTWLWNLKGKEVININSIELQHIRQVMGLRWSREYELSSVTNLRTQAPAYSMFGSRGGMDFWGLAGGVIAFDYGPNTYRFGVQLDEAEANHIVSVVKQRYKNL